MNVEEQLGLTSKPVADAFCNWVGYQRKWSKQDFDDLFDRAGVWRWRGHISLFFPTDIVDVRLESNT